MLQVGGLSGFKRGVPLALQVLERESIQVCGRRAVLAGVAD
jgi:hypothetical protein